MTNENDLLPCPFCGGKATAHTKDAHTDTPFYIVGCGAILDANGLYGGCLQRDRARSTYSYKSMDEAIAAWNTRPQSQPVQDKEGALEQARHAVAYAAEMSLGDDDYVEICPSKLRVWKEFLAALTPKPAEVVDTFMEAPMLCGDVTPKEASGQAPIADLEGLKRIEAGYRNCVLQAVGDDEIINESEYELLVSGKWLVELGDHLASRRLIGRGWMPTHRHRKRGTEYQLIGSAVMQCAEYPPIDDKRLTLYVDKAGNYWVRPPAEFNDGRFEPLPAAPDDGGE